jgi:hypothetical protein
VLGIGQERKRDVVLARELRLALLVEDADAEDRGLARFELREVGLKGAGLLRAPRRVVLWIEVENDRPAFKIRQRVYLARLILQCESRRLFSRLDERHA